MLGESGPVELGSYLHPTPPSNTWIYNILTVGSCPLFLHFLPRYLEPRIRPRWVWEPHTLLPADWGGVGVTVCGTGLELPLYFPHQTGWHRKPGVILIVTSGPRCLDHTFGAWNLSRRKGMSWGSKGHRPCTGQGRIFSSVAKTSGLRGLQTLGDSRGFWR